MRRWTLLLAGAALWLFLAAIPALADGGPHQADINNGTNGLTADSCAGCHRAHTGQTEDSLLATPTVEALCLTCHGTSGTGATTNIEDGVQYNDGAMPPVRGTSVIGALRGGGFVYARIKSSDPFRTPAELGKVSVLTAGENVTSAHLKLASEAAAVNGDKVVLQNVAWGNSAALPGGFSATPNAGPTVTITCGTCHNPHGNDLYRILRPIPNPSGLTVAAAPANVTDYLVGTPPAVPATTRNYTVIQTNAAGSRIYLASEVAAVGNSAAGDYWHKRVPWNATASANDAPNGLPDSTTGFSAQMAAWCSTCHTRYLSQDRAATGDAIYMNRHTTRSSRSCLTCHVSHGTNAQMTGTSSKAFPYPGGSRTGESSRLLKIDNRGTCQMCHDPASNFVGMPDLGTPPVPTLP